MRKGLSFFKNNQIYRLKYQSPKKEREIIYCIVENSDDAVYIFEPNE